MGNLSAADIDNLKRHFPPQDPSGRPNWAVAGGGAVKYLLTAQRIEGVRSGYGSPVEDDRIHKDLDVAVFNPRPAKLRIVYPHEIFRCEFHGTPRRCNYREAEANPTGFYFELFTGYHFGFVPPRVEDAVLCRSWDEAVWVLRPEYIIASRLFALAPVRPGIDDRDVRRLCARFEIDALKVLGYVAESAYGFIPPDEVVRHIVQPDLNPLDRLVTARVAESFPDIVGRFPAAHHRMLLRLHDAVGEAELGSAHDLALREFGHHRYSELSGWAAAFLLCVDGPEDAEVRKVVDTSGYVIYRHDELYFRLGAEFLQGMRRLKCCLETARCGHLYRELAPRATAFFIRTPYKQVILSVLATQPFRLADCSCQDEVLEKLGLLTNLVYGPRPPKAFRRSA